VIATPEYLETLRIPLLEGRRFGRADRAEGPPVAIVSRALAEKYWPGRSALGKRIQTGRARDGEPWREIVGVAGNAALGPIDDAPLPAIYLPLAQSGPRFMSVAVRAEGEPLRLAEPVRKALRELDPDVPPYWLRSLEDLIDAGRFPSRFLAALFGSFALVGIALGAIGQYAVLAYAVTQRTREIGLRRALGAKDGEIRRMVLRDGLRHLSIGLAVGLPLAAGFARVIAQELVGVPAFDPATFASVAAGLSIAVLLASAVPVRRALRVDPAVALRCE
jgi:putative ABC transport system permease protein